MTKNTTLSHLWLLVLRLGAGGFMLTHGYPKLLKLFSGDEIQFPDPFGIGATPSLVLAVFAEFLCAVLVMLGFRTRWASVPILITMLVAVFVAHAGDPFGKKEMGLLYLLCFGTLLVFGGGRYALDRVIRVRK